jgi:hypothetical protein
MSGLRMAIAAVLALITAIGCGVSELRSPRSFHAGFWFEPVEYQSTRLGGALTGADLQTIASVARSEISQAFDGLNVTLSDRREARYRVRVVQELRDQRMHRFTWVAGASRAMAGFGGTGFVNFSFLASGAMVYSAEDATRAELIAAIGRGVGRAAVHEFTHQFLPKAEIHATRDRQSYEYASATRPEQYGGDMRWSVAHPLLMARVGR